MAATRDMAPVEPPRRPSAWWLVAAAAFVLVVLVASTVAAMFVFRARRVAPTADDAGGSPSGGSAATHESTPGERARPKPPSPRPVDIRAAYEHWAEQRAAGVLAALTDEDRGELEAADEARSVGMPETRAAALDRIDRRRRFEAFLDAWLEGSADGTGPARLAVSDRFRAELASEPYEALRRQLGRRLSSRGPLGHSGGGSGSVRRGIWCDRWFECGYRRVEGDLAWSPDAGWALTGLDVRTQDPPPGEAPPDTSTVVPIPASGDRETVRYQQCELCGGLRYGLPGRPWTQVEADDGPRHEWKDRASRGLGRPVPDGTVVLIRRGADFGAFRIERQLGDPDRVTYTWIVRPGGDSVLDASASDAIHGRTVDARSIEVEWMTVEWSVATTGRGWLYYARKPGTAPGKHDVLLCVTDLADWQGVDAADPRWEYRGARGEEPLRGR